MAPFTDTDSDDGNGLGSEEGTAYTQLGATVTEGESGICFLLLPAWTSNWKPGPLLPWQAWLESHWWVGTRQLLHPPDPAVISRHLSSLVHI